MHIPVSSNVLWFPKHSDFVVPLALHHLVGGWNWVVVPTPMGFIIKGIGYIPQPEFLAVTLGTCTPTWTFLHIPR